MATLFPPPPPEKKDLWFEIPTTTLEQQIQQRRQQVEEGDVGLVDEDSNEFGLTRTEYEFLEWDIQNEIDRFDEEHGFDGTGYHERDGSYVYSLDKAKALNQRRKHRISSQEVAIARGIITVRRATEPVDDKGADQ